MQKDKEDAEQEAEDEADDEVYEARRTRQNESV